MEIIRGKHTSFMDASSFSEYRCGYTAIHIDIGTGDGRFVQHIAPARSCCLVIGIDACRENLYEVSRRAPANTLFVIANALWLPFELDSGTAHLTINFPWGSLLEGLLATDTALLAGLRRITRPDTALEIRLNAGALAEVGWSLQAGADRVQDVLFVNGFDMRTPIGMRAHDLKACPTTWAKRLAFGRDPRAIYLNGVKS